MATRAAEYGVLATPCGKVVVVIARGVRLGTSAAVIVTITGCDCRIVCVFCTCNGIVTGAARLLLPIVADKVLVSTVVVAIAFPFHKITA